MSIRSWRFLSVIMLLGVAGCTRFDYYGQSFEKLDDDTQIKIAWNSADIDPDEYRSIGQGVLTVGARKDRFDIDEELEKYARRHGANAVSVIKVESVSRGVWEKDDFNFNTQNTAEAAKDDPTFGKEIDPQKELHGRAEKDIYVRFWKNRSETDDILAKREVQLQKKAEGNWRGE